MMARDPNAEQRALTGEVRFRVPLPIIVPLGALLLIALVTIAFSRILLSVPHEIATILAVVMAANVLGACAVLASRRNTNRSVISELLIVVLYPVIVGAVIATMDLEAPGRAEPAAPANGGGGPGGQKGGNLTEEVTASGIAFDTDEIILPADGTQELNFINQDAVTHNIAIYEDDSAQKEIFVGELIADDEVLYEIEGPGEPMDAYFQCDIHPNMQGAAIFK